MGGQLRLPKSELRQLFVSAWDRRDRGEVRDASRAVCGWIVRLEAFRRAINLVAYVAQRGEIDPSGVVDVALGLGKTLYFPRVVEPGIQFLEASPGDLTPGSYGIPEPRSGRPLPRSESAVLFLVPGLAFDQEGRRLGRGGGHYDRTLALYPRGLRAGLVAEIQLAPGLPSDSWDQPVDAVVTERRLVWSAARPGIKENLT
ncbi:MAG TPA: 5-formyltetrahydrofolate cyclo-ligase [Candidatus Binatia bacterium]|nr:5-formyltetrahydrofolate cyclo-ligase [Candidatus Binatia bacterium]